MVHYTGIVIKTRKHGCHEILALKKCTDFSTQVFSSTAIWLRSTAESITDPCSVKTQGFVNEFLNISKGPQLVTPSFFPHQLIENRKFQRDGEPFG